MRYLISMHAVSYCNLILQSHITVSSPHLIVSSHDLTVSSPCLILTQMARHNLPLRHTSSLVPRPNLTERAVNIYMSISATKKRMAFPAPCGSGPVHLLFWILRANGIRKISCKRDPNSVLIPTASTFSSITMQRLYTYSSSCTAALITATRRSSFA